ncbi:TIGR00725 family protein [Peterkaempfera griseoplana]|uniref:TIGR00725 family protein n=1 Tax=Peterkaempfera griseoplana TaxID=66896 RepID=UPI0006E3DAD3|nr:TIGR00725 family protein [Peterkaempfera griseoplana]
MIQVAVCGPAECSAAEETAAREVGALLARSGVVVLCGGYGGVMAAAAEGAAGAGGLVVGILSGADRSGASPYLTACVATGMDQARNSILVGSADAVIAVGGSWGTLSEVAIAMRRGVRPVVSLGGWQVIDALGAIVPGVVPADTPAEAVRLALAGRG